MTLLTQDAILRIDVVLIMETGESPPNSRKGFRNIITKGFEVLKKPWDETYRKVPTGEIDRELVLKTIKEDILGEGTRVANPSRPVTASLVAHQLYKLSIGDLLHLGQYNEEFRARASSIRAILRELANEGLFNRRQMDAADLDKEVEYFYPGNIKNNKEGENNVENPDQMGFPAKP